LQEFGRGETGLGEDDAWELVQCYGVTLPKHLIDATECIVQQKNQNTKEGEALLLILYLNACYQLPWHYVFSL
jgi:hypothetical protein